MNTSLISSEAIELLSRITGQKLSQRDITPPILFLANLVTLLLGVILADRQVKDEEKQKLQNTLNHFIPSEGSVRELTQLMLKGVREHKIYAKSENYRILTAPLSDSEKLLLISFGYEMSIADGRIDETEKKYLQFIGKLLKLNPQHLEILELVFSDREIEDQPTLQILGYWLEPSRFQSLDLIFVNAASYILEHLQTSQKQQEEKFFQTSVHKNVTQSYKGLQEFQDSQKQIDRLCYQIYQILQDCVNRNFLASHLIQELGQLSHKIQAQKFRIAVLGEFSQGKSTFLNALLGEEIQPTRAIPCSGAVTVLKHGPQKRVICRYKDQREEEIPLGEYHLKAAISKDAAIEHRRDELSKSDIEEIIFEHPDLDLCRKGVEIIDSPGLNEHPERTAITQKLLKNTDAALFLTNAMRLLSEREKELLQDVRTQLNHGQHNRAAENLFILVNFMDSLDNENDRQDVKQRLERFAEEENLLCGKNRIHYISAKSALKAILNKTDDEYLNPFQDLTQSLEDFLTCERGTLKTKCSITAIQYLLQRTVECLSQAEDILEGKVEDSEQTKQKVLEQISEASDRAIRLKNLAEQLTGEAFIQAVDSFNEWYSNLGNLIVEKSDHWRSEYSHIWSQDQLIRDYTDQFIRDLQTELSAWGHNHLEEEVLSLKLEILDQIIRQEVENIQDNSVLLDTQINSHFSQQVNFKMRGLEGEITYTGGALVLGLLAFTGVEFIGVILNSVVTTLASSLGLGLLDVEGVHEKIKLKIIEQGFQTLDESLDHVEERLYKIVISVFNHKVKVAVDAIAQVISDYEQFLEQQAKTLDETLEHREVEKIVILQKRQELDHIQHELETLLSQVSR